LDNSLGLLYILLINLAITSGFSIFIIRIGFSKLQNVE
jgi:hypothetical protein